MSVPQPVPSAPEPLAQQVERLQGENRQLAELARRKDEFVASASHELRTPLTAIKEGVTLMLDEALGGLNDEQRDFLKTVDENIDRLTELINNMLDLAKIEAGRLILTRRRTALAPLVQAALSSFRAMAGARTLAVEGDGAPDVFADPDRTVQVLTNLLSNAVKFTGPDGTITITVRPGPEDVLISVRDNGVGIAAEDLPKLFQRFSQVGVGGGRHKGTGLGLALCKELVELQRGTLDVASEAGRGSTFSFRLPVWRLPFVLEEHLQEQLRGTKAGEDETVGVLALPVANWTAGVEGSACDALCQWIKKHVHRGDVVLPSAPDWVLIMAAADPAGLQAMAGRVRATLRATGTHDGRLGLAVCPEHGADAARLVEYAKAHTQSA